MSRPDIDLNWICGDLGDLVHSTAVYKAITHKHFEIAHMLIKAGANYNEVIHAAFVSPRQYLSFDTSEIGKCLARVIDAIDFYKPQLYAALEQNDEQQVRLLLQKVPFRIKDKDGNTLLHRAVRNCSPEIIGLLLKLDPQAFIKHNEHGQTPLDVALIYDRLGIVKFLIKFAYTQKSS